MPVNFPSFTITLGQFIYIYANDSIRRNLVFPDEKLCPRTQEVVWVPDTVSFFSAVTHASTRIALGDGELRRCEWKKAPAPHSMRGE